MLMIDFCEREIQVATFTWLLILAAYTKGYCKSLMSVGLFVCSSHNLKSKSATVLKDQTKSVDIISLGRVPGISHFLYLQIWSLRPISSYKSQTLVDFLL